MSQRALVLWVISLAILPFVALSGVTSWQQFEDEQERVAAERVHLAGLASLAVEAFLDGHVASARSLAEHPALARPRKGPELDALTARIAQAHPEWQGLGIVGADGYSVASSLGGQAVFVGDRPYFRQAVTSGRPVASSALIGRLSGKATVVIAVPLDLEGGGRGVLAVPLPTDRFGELLARKLGRPSLQLTVIDSESQTFIDPDPRRVAQLVRLRGTPQAEAVLAGKSGSLVADAGGVPMLIAYAPVAGFGWGVLISEPAASAFGPARREALERAGVLALILAAVGALGWLLGGRLAFFFQRAEHARADLQRSLDTRDEFLAAASHDLRNPLAAICSAASLLDMTLQRKGAVPPERLASCIAHIGSASRRMTALIDAFLDVARLQTGRQLELERRSVDLVPLVREIVQECQQTSARHRIELEVPGSLVTQADAARLQRTIGNLIGNAIKYSPEGGEVRVQLSQEGPSGILLSVRDHGLGIPQADLERVFHRFERGTNVAGRIAGTGIGLATARQVIEAHGGRIEIESAPGAGTTVQVRLPLAGVAGTRVASEQAAA